MKKRGCLQGVGSPSSFISSFLHLFVFVACLFLFSFEEQLRRTYWLEIYLIKGAKYEKTFYLLLLVWVVVLILPQCQNAPQEKKAKYVFYFIGDGMGVNQVNGTEMYLAEKEGRIGLKPLNFTQFPVVNVATTYSKYNSVTCSAAAGTALATGSKTKMVRSGWIVCTKSRFIV